MTFIYLFQIFRRPVDFKWWLLLLVITLDALLIFGGKEFFYPGSPSSYYVSPN